MPGELLKLPEQADQVVIGLNPIAGSGARRGRAAQLEKALKDRGLKVTVLTDLEAIAETANRLHTQGRLRALVAAGGDGTTAELANRTVPGVPLAPLPLGTENLLARHIGHLTPAAVEEAIAEGIAVRLDAGSASGRLFLLMADCGFDAEVVRRLQEARRGHISHWTYIKPILGAVRSYEYPLLTLHGETFGGQDCSAANEFRLTARWAFLFNLPCYMFGLKVAPEAVGTDGLLDVCAFQGGSVWNVARYLTGVMLRRHLGFHDCSTARVRRVRIESEQLVPYLLDGDFGGYLPVEIEVLPQRLTMIVPRDWAASHNLSEASANV